MIIMTNKPTRIIKDRTGNYEVVFIDRRNSDFVNKSIKEYIIKNKNKKNYIIVVESAFDEQIFKDIADLIIEGYN